MNLVQLTRQDHDSSKDRRGFSHWIINKPRRLRIKVQKYKGRLYLVGGIVLNMKWVYPFEMPIATLNRVPGITFTKP